MAWIQVCWGCPFLGRDKRRGVQGGGEQKEEAVGETTGQQGEVGESEVMGRTLG